MIPLHKALSSTVGKKVIMGASGLGLVVFLILHLAGNLTLYRADGTAFNVYAYTLDSYGLLKTIAELGLVALFGIHIVYALGLTSRNSSARPVKYKTLRSKGGPRDGRVLSNSSSRNMIITGIALLGFLVLHVWQFRFHGGQEVPTVKTDTGLVVADLHSVVHTTFGNPLFVAIYVAAMLFMGFHFRHGFWSAFQSLGAMNARLTKPVYALGVFLAVLLAVGFLFIPIWIYFDIPPRIAS